MSHLPHVGVLARTECGSGAPFLDDLSHHMLVVASANLATGSREAVLASLMHDMFKGLMVWKTRSNCASWLHFSKRPDVYENLIPSNLNVNIRRVTDFIRTHHDPKNTQNPIRRVEVGYGPVTSLESKFILEQVPANTKSLVLKLSGRHRWLLMFYVHRHLKQELTTLYSEKLNDALGVREIHYHYRPAKLTQTFTDIDACLRHLDLNALKMQCSGDSLHIYLPVLGLTDPMTIAYGDYNSLTQDKGSLHVPFGAALSLMAFDSASTGKARILYVDAGFTVTLDNVIKKCLQELKKPSSIKHSPPDIARSLEGTFGGPEHCSFCGERTDAKLRLRDTSRFTSIHLLLDSRLRICPACEVGFELEEQLRGKFFGFRISAPALVDGIKLGQSFNSWGTFVKGGDYLMSLSGELWLQVLSELWYQKYQQMDDPAYILDPTAALLPLEVKFIPQATYPVLLGGRKKFALESSLSSSSVLPAKSKDIDADEFRAIREAYRNLGVKVKAENFIKRIKQIYDIGR